MPTLGATGIRGFEAAVPYYLNLAPNYDATLTPRLMTKRGLQLGGQGRYLFETVRRRDQRRDPARRPRRPAPTAGACRSGTTRISARSRPGSPGYLNLNKVSDDTYFADLSDRIAVTSQSTLPREGGLHLVARAVAGAGAGADLPDAAGSDGAAPVTPPYNRMPQFAGRLLETDWLGLSFDGTGEYVRFRQSALTPTGDAHVHLPAASRGTGRARPGR